MWSTFQKTGDILFTRSRGLAAFANRAGQLVTRGKLPGPTHVILCVVPGLYMHSTKARGVEVARAEDVRLANTPMPRHSLLYRVVRPAVMTPDMASDLIDKAIYFHGQKYNSLFFAKTLLASERYQKSAAFCSEYVCAVYRAIKGELIARPDEEVYPGMLESSLQAPDWIDVTDEYRKGLARMAEQEATPLEETLRSAILFSVLTNQRILYLAGMSGRFGELIERGWMPDREIYEGLARIWRVPRDPVERYFDLVESLVDAKEANKLSFRQDVDPYLAPKTVAKLIARVEETLIGEKQVLTTVREKLERDFGTVSALYDGVLSCLSSDEATINDKESYARFLANLHTLASTNVVDLLETMLQLFASLDVNHEKSFDTATAQKRFKDLCEKAVVRQDLLKACEILWECVLLRFDLYCLAFKVAAMRSQIPNFQELAESARQKGLLPPLPTTRSA
jgi:hypothetical protein